MNRLMALFVVTTMIGIIYSPISVPKIEKNKFPLDPKHFVANVRWEYNEMINKKLPDDALHPYALTSDINDGVTGKYEGVCGTETYYDYTIMCMDIVIHTAREYGYAEDEYPFHINEYGCCMLGDYIMCFADYNTYPYGSILDTSLGKGIVIDVGDEGVIGIYTNWL